MPIRHSIRYPAAAFGDRALHLDGAAHRVEDAREFDEHSVAGGLDDAALPERDLGIDQIATQAFETRECPFLVRFHEPRIAGDIGGEDRREPSRNRLSAHHRLPAGSASRGRSVGPYRSYGTISLIWDQIDPPY